MEIKKSDFKKVILPSIIAIVIFCVIFLEYIAVQNIRYTKIFNSNLEQIILKVKEAYPDVSEQAIIKTIQRNNVDSKEQSFLKQYGYEEDQMYLESLSKEIARTKQYCIIIIVLLGLSMILIDIIYIIRQNRKVRQIDKYLKKVNNGNYGLKIEENSEDELSKLRNELYKTTIILRETAENSKKESENLSISLADISHQLKTPLTSMRIMIDNLCDNSEMDNDTRNEFLKIISSQIEWISSLVISLLKLSKFDSGAIEMSDKMINAKSLINEVTQNLSILLEVKNIEVIIDSPDEAEFMADYKWQLEAITNIVKNAIEHTDENSKIYITVEDTNLFLKITIRDEGYGIEKEDLKHIFERFYKSSNSSEDSIGIGLSLAKAIIEKDNGYITVDSKVGEGTTFTIKYLK